MLYYNHNDSNWLCICGVCGFQEVDGSEIDVLTSLIIEKFKVKGWKFTHKTSYYPYYEESYCPDCVAKAKSSLQVNKLFIFSEDGSIRKADDSFTITLPVVRNFITCYEAIFGKNTEWVIERAGSLLSFIEEITWPFVDSSGQSWVLTNSMFNDITREIYDDSISMEAVLTTLFGFPSYDNTVAYREFPAKFLLVKRPELIKTLHNGFWSQFVEFFSECGIPLYASLPCSIPEFMLYVDSIYDADIRDYFGVC